MRRLFKYSYFLGQNCILIILFPNIAIAQFDSSSSSYTSTASFSSKEISKANSQFDSGDIYHISRLYLKSSGIDARLEGLPSIKAFSSLGEYSLSSNLTQKQSLKESASLSESVSNSISNTLEKSGLGKVAKSIAIEQFDVQSLGLISPSKMPSRIHNLAILDGNYTLVSRDYTKGTWRKNDLVLLNFNQKGTNDVLSLIVDFKSGTVSGYGSKDGERLIITPLKDEKGKLIVNYSFAPELDRL